MSNDFNWLFKYPSQRRPILADNIVSTSQPLASQAGLQMLLKGGNAVDAAIAAAITLTIVEPTMNGIGSDAFSIVWDGKRIIGLNASGKSPGAWTPDLFSDSKEMPIIGWGAVTVPGAVSAWVELSKKYGQLKFKELFEPAIKYAEKGFLVSPITAELWQSSLTSYKRLIPNFTKIFPEFIKVFSKNGKAPNPGEPFLFPNHAKTLRLIAETEGEAFYHGSLAKKIVSNSEETGGYFTLEDFENHTPIWENTISVNFKDILLHEIPPNGQGLSALIVLGILDQFDISSFELDSYQLLHLQIEAMKLAFVDTYRYISDPESLEFDPSNFITPRYLEKRAKLINFNKAESFNAGIPTNGDTVYLTSADSDGMMVSYIQSNYERFGSCIVIPGTGISLQNRGKCFSLVEGHPNQIGPNKRPFHTIMPAFVTRKGRSLMSFGVMGGAMQPQGHAQLITRIFTHGQNPQNALDAPRWRISEDMKIQVEAGFDQRVLNSLSQLGHQITIKNYTRFGGGQVIYKLDDGYLGASDWRKDGQAVGF